MQVWTLTQRPADRGIEFVRSRHFPDSAQGNFLFNNTIGFQGIKQYKTRRGRLRASSASRSSRCCSRPIRTSARWRCSSAPDGALYVVDWFNPLVGHMQYSLRDPRRDKTHGRVWRITAKGRPLQRTAADRRRSRSRRSSSC